MRACNSNKQLGKIHSYESFGTHEGPGIRYVIFLQGCLAKCIYCQNPDTWDTDSENLATPKEVFSKIESYLPYINSSKGGVTFSGGEPLLQIDFLISLCRICKQNSVHTAIDTGCFYPPNTPKSKINTLIKTADLFIVDLKAANPKLHKKITSRDLKEVLSFIRLLEKQKKAYWIRYVLVPGLNDSKEDIRALKGTLAGFKHMERFEFLPYHSLGKHKWEYLGLKYPLNKTPAATQNDLKRAQEIYTGKQQ